MISAAIINSYRYLASILVIRITPKFAFQLQLSDPTRSSRSKNLKNREIHFKKRWMISIYTGSYQQILKRIKRKNLRKNARHRGPAEIESLESRKLCNNVNIITLGVYIVYVHICVFSSVGTLIKSNNPVVGPHIRPELTFINCIPRTTITWDCIIRNFQAFSDFVTTPCAHMHVEFH